MNFTLLTFLNFALVCLESVMTAYLGNCFFQIKCSKVEYILSICLLAVLSNLTLFLFDTLPIIKFLLTLTLPICWFTHVYRCNVVKSLFISVLLLSFWKITDTLFLMCVSSILGDSFRTSFQSPYEYYLMCFSAKCLELLGIVILRACTRGKLRSYTMGWNDWLRVLFFPLTTLFLSVELLYIFYGAPDMARELSLCMALILFTDVMAVFLLDYMEKQHIAIRDNAILKQDLKAERESIEAWTAAYQEERKRSHDFQNQLSVLRGMADKNALSEEFLQYLDSLLNKKLPATRYINTNRPVADVLLSQKSAIAKSKGIAFQMDLDDLSSFPLSDDELVVVLANLIDNAMEACEKIPIKEQRLVHIKIQCRPEASYFHIENTTETPVKVKDNRIIPPRKSAAEHGFGLKNVLTILKSHQALYLLEYHSDEKTFCFSAQLLTGQ